MTHERFLEPAQRVLDGDDSIEAANELAAVLRDDFPGDERTEDLLEVLARVAAGEDAEAAEVRTVIRETIARLV
ncbi:hypothetical protein [Nocardioides bizhenqiangii]|uniref:Uncharacterized protein n=1 Tax=Nocardioides bizhenqiangii TaxID=3095076 RepID=A0ABZ0ZQN9_9ACTN|nr:MULTISPECIES: hypothetical protein [unclassified Nocardioides]MDZ5620061.1 hypothetical protein [Nocardioides sp. HM23]WQQ25937.1 hypothetical protein SHK19_18460 [Nocardioides sp. HM61]